MREAYAEFRNIAKVAAVLGINPGSAHERLNRLGVKTPPSRLRLMTEEDEARLRKDYLLYRENGKLADLAKEMGRGKTTIVYLARKLGLIQPYGKGRRNLYTAVWKHMDEKQAGIIFESFKAQSLGMGRFCKQKGFDDLGFSRTMQKFFPEEWEHVLELKVPKQSLYRLGRAVEYRARDHLRKLGYFVLRSPASKSPIDLVAIRKGQILFIQCKRSGLLGPDEWNELFRLCASVGAVPILAGMHDSGRGIVYSRLLGEKDGSKKRQPFEPFVPGEAPPQDGLFGQRG